MAKYLKQPFKD